MSLRDRLIDPRSAERRPRRAAYALPTMFTAGNIFLGFYALRSRSWARWTTLQNAAGSHLHFQTAALAIGLAVFAGRSGRPHRAHDQHHQRFWPGDGFAGRLHLLRDRAGGAGLRLGHPVRRASHRSDHAGPASPRGVFFLLRVPVVRRGAPGALQHHQESDPQESRKIRPQILRRPAHSIGRRAGRRRGLRGGQHAAALVGVLRAMAGSAGPAVVSHGQHVALSQLQGRALAAAQVSDFRRGFWLHHLPDLAFSAAGAAGAVGWLRLRAASPFASGGAIRRRMRPAPLQPRPQSPPQPPPQPEHEIG